MLPQIQALYERLDQLLSSGPALIAIEGGSASGKTTLSEILAQTYHCTVFHMDDFFLQPYQRTLTRFAQPGGNVDWERFLTEVLLPLKKNEVIRYRRFNCKTMSMEEEVLIQPTKSCIIEGVYSMHPELESYYDMSIFLNIDPSLQKERIRKRNTPLMAERFFTDWIPLENMYFEKTDVKKRCNFIIECDIISKEK